MAIPQIQIDTRDIQMNYRTTQPQLNISQQQANMQIEQPAATLDITAKQGTLHIDQSKAFAEAGAKSVKQLNDEYVQKGKQAVMQMMAKKAQQGEQLMHGAGKGQGAATLQQIVKQNTGLGPPAKSNITFIPSPGAVKIDFTPGEFDIDIQAQQPKIDVQVTQPQFDFTYGTVKGTMTQRPAVEVYV